MSIGYICRYTGKPCVYATSIGYCQFTACVKHETVIKPWSWTGKCEAFTPKDEKHET